MINEIRMLLAETLLGWCLSLAPDNEDGARLVKMIKYYLKVAANLDECKKGLTEN